MKTILSIIFIVSVGSNVYGQQILKDILAKLHAANANKTLSYEYKVYLSEAGKIGAVDSIIGKLYKKGDSYFDSSSVCLTVVNDKFFCKIDKDAKEVIVADLEKMYKKLGSSFSSVKPGIIDVEDSVILKYGEAKVSNANNGNYVINIWLQQQNLSNIKMIVDKSSYKILNMEFIIDEMDKYGEKSGIKRIYKMGHFQPGFDERLLSLNRFVGVEKNKIILNPRYKSYHLLSINN